VTIHDRAADRKAVFQSKGKVLPADFGLVRVGTFSDREGKAPEPPVGVVGEVLYVGVSAVGFARDKKTSRPDVDVSLKVLDEAGKPTLAAPLSGRAGADALPDQKLLGMMFGVALNRPGRFTLELSATDRLSGKTARVSFPVRVFAAE
jgi:hypothetical protein